jgi:hypothetical protein
LTSAGTDAALDIAEDGEEVPTVTAAKPVKLTWPGSVSERIQALRTTLAAAAGPTTADALARQFNLRKPAVIADLLNTRVDLGFVRRLDGDRYEAAH